MKTIIKFLHIKSLLNLCGNIQPDSANHLVGLSFYDFKASLVKLSHQGKDCHQNVLIPVNILLSWVIWGFLLFLRWVTTPSLSLFMLTHILLFSLPITTPGLRGLLFHLFLMNTWRWSLPFLFIIPSTNIVVLHSTISLVLRILDVNRLAGCFFFWGDWMVVKFC